MKTISALLLPLVFLLPQVFGQVAFPNHAPPADSPRSRLVLRYIDAFNDGETEMLAFWRSSSVSELPLEERLKRYRSMRADLGKLKLRRTLSEHSDGVDILAESSDGQRLQMTFLMADGADPKLSGIQIQPAADDGSVEVPRKSANESRQELESVVLDQIRQIVQAKAKDDLFSGAILIARGQKVMLEESYGLADKNFRIPNQVSTRFDTGSIAKSFTQIAIGQLVEQGKLQVDDTLGKYLPEYPNEAARGKVTIGELLDMRSGIGDVFGPKLEATPVGNIRRLADYLPLFESQPLAFEPGTRQAYSNGGYILLGMILEKVTGESYYDYVQKHIFAPAGMKNSDFPFSDMPHDGEATGYTMMTGDSPPSATARALRANFLMMPARGCSAGSARTTVGDLFLYSQALSAEVLLKKSTAEKLKLPISPIGIGGGGPGVNAGLQTGIHSAGSSEYTLVIMSNYDPPAATELMKQISSMLRNIQ